VNLLQLPLCSHSNCLINCRKLLVLQGRCTGPVPERVAVVDSCVPSDLLQLRRYQPGQCLLVVDPGRLSGPGHGAEALFNFSRGSKSGNDSLWLDGLYIHMAWPRALSSVVATDRDTWMTNVTLKGMQTPGKGVLESSGRLYAEGAFLHVPTVCRGGIQLA
jgi:hypothetical protein